MVEIALTKKVQILFDYLKKIWTINKYNENCLEIYILFNIRPLQKRLKLNK